MRPNINVPRPAGVVDKDKQGFAGWYFEIRNRTLRRQQIMHGLNIVFHPGPVFGIGGQLQIFFQGWDGRFKISWPKGIAVTQIGIGDGSFRFQADYFLKFGYCLVILVLPEEFNSTVKMNFGL